MRKYILFFLAAFFILPGSGLFAQGQSSGKIVFTVSGEIKGLKKDAIVWLGLYEAYGIKGQVYKTLVKGGNFTITGETYHPTIALLSFYDLDKDGKPVQEFPLAKKVEFFVSEGSNKLIIDSLFSEIKVKNSNPSENHYFEILQKKTGMIERKLDSLYTAQFTAGKNNDTLSLRYLLPAIKETASQLAPLYSDFISTYKNSYISICLLLTQGPGFTIDHRERLFNHLSARLKNSTSGKEVSRQIELIKNPAFKLVGTMMPDAVVFDTAGNNIRLSVFKGKWLLLDFWASWCTPCRATNKELKELYKEFGNDKMEFISVSIDSKKSDWLNAVRSDLLTWPQLLDDIPAEKTAWYAKAFLTYRGTGVPTSFLISPGGTIYELNPTIESIKKILQAISK